MDAAESTGIAAGFTPGVEPHRCENRTFAEATLRLPVVDSRLLAEVCDRVLTARQRIAGEGRIERAVAAIDEAVRRWGDPSYSLRALAERALPAMSGYSREMISFGLHRILDTFRRPGLEELLETELGMGWRAASFEGPRLIAQVLAGNIPAVAAESIVRALLLGSASIIKASSHDPLFPALFARSIHDADPGLGATIAVLWWKGGSGEVDEAAIGAADAVVAYGRNEAIESVRRYAADGVSFAAYGPRISFAAIGRETLNAPAMTDLCARAAQDVSLFDQQGCVAPHAIFVERGGAASPRDFAGALTHAMAAFEARYPRGRLTPAEAGAIVSLRGEYEVRQASGRDVALFASVGSTAWTVIYDEEGTTLTPSCLNRVVRVIPIDDLSQLPGAVRPLGALLQTAGVEADASRLAGVGGALAEVGVTRVCPIGEMQFPPASWPHDGEPNLTRFLRKCLE